MTLTAQYQRFIASPSTEVLADGAVLSYIPTLTTLREPTAILKHLSAQAKQLKKKGEKVLNAIESSDSVCLDIETTLEFVTSGGAYLPGLDDNFLADRVVSFPVIHIVQFDAEGKILAIRQHWDQGSLLRQVEIIGARGRNWPIRDGKDQLKLIQSTASFANEPVTASSRRGTTSSVDPSEASRPTTSSSNSSKNVMRDPHASLSLFDPAEEKTPPRKIPSTARHSAKPPPRDMSEIFVGDETTPETPTSKTAARGGATKGFQPIRLFEGQNDNATPEQSPERSTFKAHPANYNHFEFGEGEDAPTPTTQVPPSNRKTTAKKYNHFEFGEGEDAPSPSTEVAPSAVRTASKKYNHFEFGNGEEDQGMDPSVAKARSAKHNSKWSFEDFTTPSKPQPQVKVKREISKQDQRHFGWSDDEIEETPIKHTHQAKERPNTRPHFAFADDGTPDSSERKPTGVRGNAGNKGMGIYSNHVIGEEDSPEKASRPLRDVKNVPVNASHRQKDFGAHWDNADSPTVAEGVEVRQKSTLTESNKRVLSGLDASWQMTDDSPDTSAVASKKENRGIQQRGDGMGGRTGSSRNWGFGEDSDPEEPLPGRKPQKKETNEEKSWWDF